MKPDLQDAWKQELNDLKPAHRFRSLKTGSGLSLSGNDYLGLSRHPELNSFASILIQQGVPLGSTGSRLLSGTHRHHLETEEQIAAWKGAEAALLFNSGYDANTGVISTLIPKNAIVFSDRLNHACIVDGIRATGAHVERFRHLDMMDLEQRIRKVEGDSRPKFLIVESVYSMDGDKPDFALLTAWCHRYGIHLIVDEAHGTGVFGQKGIGVLEESGFTNVPLVTVHTCGKALGTAGAFVTGSRVVIDKLINQCRNFIFTTAMSPFQAALIGKSVDLVTGMNDERGFLASLSLEFRHLLRRFKGFSTGNSTSMIIPFIVGTDSLALHLADSLQKKGFDVRAIRPPTVPEGTSRLRFSLHTGISRTDLDQVVIGLEKALQE